MINFNGSLTHLPGKKWKFEKSLTVDKSYLIDMVAREDEIEADSQTQIAAHEIRTLLIKEKNQ